MKKFQSNESGIAHLWLAVVVIVVIGGGFFGYTRVKDASKTQNNATSIEQTAAVAELPNNLENIKPLEEVQTVLGVSDTVSVVRFTLESKDSGYVYKVVLSNGKKFVVNAITGKILSEETTSVSEDDKIPAGVKVTLSPAQAYKLAAAKSSSPIKSIEMEVEDKKVVYKIEFKDGSKIEIDASSGSVVKSEIKNASPGSERKSEQETEDSKDEQKVEDSHENEDSDDSQDSENHAEEDKKDEDRR